MSVQADFNLISFIMEVVKRERIIYGQLDPRPPFTTSFSSIFLVCPKNRCFLIKKIQVGQNFHICLRSGPLRHFSKEIVNREILYEHRHKTEEATLDFFEAPFSK